jgi:hypothetical protein
VTRGLHRRLETFLAPPLVTKPTTGVADEGMVDDAGVHDRYLRRAVRPCGAYDRQPALPGAQLTGSLQFQRPHVIHVRRVRPKRFGRIRGEALVDAEFPTRPVIGLSGRDRAGTSRPHDGASQLVGRSVCSGVDGAKRYLIGSAL